MPTLNVQLAVKDMTASVEFYTRLFGTPPDLIEVDRAVFIKADPDVRITVKQRGPGERTVVAGVSLQMESKDFIFTERPRLESIGMMTEHGRPGCIYTNPDRLFVRDPDGNRWDFFRRPELEDVIEVRERRPVAPFDRRSPEPLGAANNRFVYRAMPLRPEA